MPSILLAHDHIPRTGKRQPVSTYRIQLSPEFGFNQANELLPYLDFLGITDVYLSPILQAAPGSNHGYDVVDHSRISTDLGGEDAFVALSESIHRANMGLVVDVVPNHMAFPTPLYHNRQIWSVLRYGRESPYVKWFDIETEEPVLLPILGAPIGKVLTEGQLEVQDLQVSDTQLEPQQVLRYFNHIFPLAEGTADLPLEVLLEKQNYRLAHWEITNEELNYRRFFDIGSLVGLRVEDPEVFQATHTKILEMVNRGLIDGLRIDHSDGLADPAEYFSRLHEATDGIWIVTEKILAENEDLPAAWKVAGTTGYDCSYRLGQLSVNPQAIVPLGILMEEITGDALTDYSKKVKQSKHEVLSGPLRTELNRLAKLAHTVCSSDIRLRDTTMKSLTDCLTELIVAMDRYRTYFVQGQPLDSASEDTLNQAGAIARDNLPEKQHDTLEILLALLEGKSVGAERLTEMKELAQLQVSFQQVCGATMAKGVEDTTFYRWTHLSELCEVGGNPGRFGMTPDDFHSWAQLMQSNWPVGMTSLSTHDSKRSEDVRAQMSVITQDYNAWIELVKQVRRLSLHYRPATLRGSIENFIYQTIAGTWNTNQPIAPDRLQEYVLKSAREQKLWTSWINPAKQAEHETMEFAGNLLADPDVLELFQNFYDSHFAEIRTVILASKAMQLLAPGVADNYQGCESLRYLLVDPDNRSLVDFLELQDALKSLDAGETPANLAAEKLWLTSRLLRLRRNFPSVFASPKGIYQPLATTSSSLLAFGRGTDSEMKVVCVADFGTVPQKHGFSYHATQVILPAGSWHSVLTGTYYPQGAHSVSQMLTTWPVEVLLRAE